jgi:hypothetical protein
VSEDAFSLALSRHTPRSKRSISIALLIVAALLYAPGLNIWAYGDDFGFLARAADSSSRWDIFGTSSYLFRPLERLVNSLNVALLGYETTLLSHAVALLGFLVAAALVFGLSLALLSGSRTRAAIATAYFVVLPANILSIIQIDTLSQQYAVVFSLLLTYWLLAQRHRRLAVYGAVAGLLAFLALCSKETAVGAVLALPLVVHLLWLPRDGRRNWAGWRTLVISDSAIAAALLVYLALRLVSGATFGDPNEPYGLHLSVALVAKNAARLAGGLIYAGSSLDLFPHLQPARIVVSAVLTLGLGFMAAIGLLNPSQRDPDGGPAAKTRPGNLAAIAGLGTLILAGMFPVVLIGHMSELYIYSSSPFYALLLGLLVERGYRAIGSFGWARPYASRAVLVFLAIVIAWLAWGTRGKLALALDVSGQAERYFHQTQSWLADVPEANVTLCWRSDLARSETGAYSGFVMPDRVILRGVVAFAGQLESKRVDYVEEGVDARACDYEAFVGERGLTIVPRASGQE